MDDIKKELNLFKNNIDKITRARSPLQLKSFVIGQYPSRYFQYRQILIECGAKWDALEEAERGKKTLELDIEELNLFIEELNFDRHKPLVKIDLQRKILEKEKKEKELEKINHLMTGALKEVLDMLTIAKNEFSDMFNLSEEQINELESEYWVARFGRQIAIDLACQGSITAGNMQSLLNLPKDISVKCLEKAFTERDSFLDLNKAAAIEYQNHFKLISSGVNEHGNK